MRTKSGGRGRGICYLLKDGNTVISNCDRLASTLGEEYGAGEIQIMRRLEKFQVDRSEKPLPKVKEAGIPSCLMLWRMADSYHADADWFNFYLCTGKTVYIFLSDRRIPISIAVRRAILLLILGCFPAGSISESAIIRKIVTNTAPFVAIFLTRSSTSKFQLYNANPGNAPEQIRAFHGL